MISVSKNSRAGEKPIKQVGKLHAVEKEAKSKSPEERAALRQAKARPVFDDLEAWLQAQLPRLSGKTKLAEAIRYALKPMPEARAYLGDGRLELDNNICERSIRPVAPGRKILSLPGLRWWRRGCRYRLRPH